MEANHTLRTLTALESNVVNNTMLVQISILARVFLGVAIGPKEGLGILVVQAAPYLKRRP